MKNRKISVGMDPILGRNRNLQNNKDLVLSFSVKDRRTSNRTTYIDRSPGKPRIPPLYNPNEIQDLLIYKEGNKFYLYFSMLSFLI